MHFPKYWGRGNWTGREPDGREVCRAVWRSSDESVEHAEALAREAARNLGHAVERGEDADYPYLDREMREPVLRELSTGDPACAAVITRTSNGCEVLNAASVMFVDVDVPGRGVRGGSGGLIAWLSSLFSGKPAEPAPEPPGGDAQIETLVRWQAANPEWTFRVYRTYAGLRYLVTHGLHDPVSERTHAALTALGCDPRYKQLCKVQKSFRARLTPKPWRCDCARPPLRFPYEDKYQGHMDRWVEKYLRAAEGSAVCHFVQTVGRHTTHPAVARVIAEHDACTKADSNLPLA